MADLIFTASYDQVKKANEEILKTGSNAQKSASVFQKAFARVEREQQKQLTAVNRQLQASRRMEAQRQREAAAAQKAAQQQERATQRAANAQRQLIERYNDGARASRIYRQTISELIQVKRMGGISADQYRQKVAQLKDEFRAFQDGTATFGNRFAQQSEQFGRSMNRMGMATQQVGYQVGDFLVQVQSGTNWMVAFGQQATQAVGVLGMMNPALIGLAAGLGIAIPLVTALGAAWMRTKEGTDEATESTDRMTEALKRASQEVERINTSLGMFLSGTESESEYGLEQQIEAVNKQLEKATENYNKLKEASGASVTGSSGFAPTGLGGGIIANIQSGEIEEARQEVEKLQEALEKLQEALKLEEVFELGGMFEGLASEIDEITAATEQMKQANIDNVAALNEQAGALRQQLYLQELSNQYGADSLVYLQAKNEMELANLRTKLEQAAAAGTVTLEEQRLMETVIALTAQQQQATEEAWRTADALSAVGNVNMAGTVSAINSVTKALGVATAQAIALARTLPGYSGGGVSGPDGAVAQSQALTTNPALIRASFDRTISGIRASSGGGGSGSRRSGGGSSSGGSGGTKVKTLAEQLRDQIEPLVNSLSDVIADGLLDGFKDTGKKLLDDFKGTLKKMISLALQNQIKIALGLNGGKTVANPAIQFASAGSSNNILASLSGNGSSLLGSFGAPLGGKEGLFAGGGLKSLAGGQGFFGGLGNALGGGKGLFSVGANATAAGGGFMATLGAAAPIIGGAGALISAFRKKTKVLDEGMQVHIQGATALAETYKEVEESRFWGLSKSRRSSTGEAPSEVQKGIQDTVTALHKSVKENILAIGGQATAIDSFNKEIKVSTQGLTNEEALEAVIEQMGELEEQMALAALGTEDYIKDNETAVEALNRLRDSLNVTNPVMELLGHQLFDISVAGADAASNFADLFGSLGDLVAVSSQYYEDFYSDQQKLENMNRQLSEVMSSINLSIMPETVSQFRALVDALDAVGNREAVAELMKIAPVFRDIIEASNEALVTAAQEKVDMAANMLRLAEERLERFFGDPDAERFGNNRDYQVALGTSRFQRDVLEKEREAAEAALAAAEAAQEAAEANPALNPNNAASQAFVQQAAAAAATVVQAPASMSPVSNVNSAPSVDNTVAITNLNRTLGNLVNGRGTDPRRESELRNQIRSLGGVPSYIGGYDTHSGARVGGLDGLGGHLAMIHPNERVEDKTRRRGTNTDGLLRELIDEMKTLRSSTSLSVAKLAAIADNTEEMVNLEIEAQEAAA